MKWRAFKYLILFVLPLGAWASFTSYGWVTFLPVIIAFGIIPLLELLFRPDASNLHDWEEEVVKHDRLYDVLLYIHVPIHFILLFVFLSTISDPTLSVLELVGRISGMGMLCGVTGINLAHELGHRSTTYEKVMSKALLLSSMYMHFYIEHNRGHHKYVGTEEDPATSRYGEWLYTFWLRSISKGYLSAWNIESVRLKKLNANTLSGKNEMIQFTVIQLLTLVLIVWACGPFVLIAFILAALIGILLLETVNYIEHYGLMRLKNEAGRYEVTQPIHSWNSNHIVGRVFLFELSRHSDHHYKANRKYQILKTPRKQSSNANGISGYDVTGFASSAMVLRHA